MPTCTLVKLAEYTSQSQAQSTLSTAVGVSTENTVTEFWIVNFDGPTNAYTAMTASAGGNTIPQPGDTYAGASTLFCDKVMSKPNGDTRNSFIVQVDYTDDVATDPLSKPAEITWEFDHETEPYFVDNTPGTAKKVLNSAGEPFENLLEREAGKLKAVVKKNQASYDPALAITYNEVVNSDSFMLDGKTIAVGQCRLAAITAGAIQKIKIETTTITYREVTYNLYFRTTWDDVIEDRGYNETDGMGGIKGIKKGTQDPLKPDKPWPLNGHGVALVDPTADPAPLTFKPYKTQAFASIASNFV